jgi:phosphoserine phosphatase RsbU/P
MGTEAPSTTRILIVDDHEDNVEVIRARLEAGGYQIESAADGIEALERVRQSPPDLILLDVMMPELDGLEVCRMLKGDPRLRDIPVIFLSALSDESDIVSGLKLGAVDYIPKPIRAEEVSTRVANLLSRQHLERELERSRAQLDRELANAGRMQQLILPATLPAHPSAAFSAYYRTSRHAGGDYYDVLTLDPHRFAIFVADVSGHGAPAAIVMAMIRAVLHTYPGLPDEPPAVLRYINHHFRYLWDTSMFATALCAVLDLERRTLRVSSAGHPVPLMLRSQQVEGLPVENTCALFFTDLGDVPCTEHPLRSGDRLLFYTDGVTDRRAPDDSMFERDRLGATLVRLGSLQPPVLVDHLVAELESFAAGVEPDDDQTLLLVALTR